MIRYSLALIFLAILSTMAIAQSVSVDDLQFEYLSDPVGVGEQHPRLSWKLRSEGTDVHQVAYQVRVATDRRDLERGRRLFWDSKRVESGQSVLVPYGGPEPRSRQRFYWQVRVWDNHGNASTWSAPAFWEMGLLSPADWAARWIEPAWSEDETTSQPAPMLRKAFRLKNEVASARVYVTSHGIYEAMINGRRVGDLLLTPGWTSFNERLQYQTYDVTDLLRKGDNALGVTLGDGWYRGTIGWGFQRNRYGKRLGLLLQLEVTYRNGQRELIVSDDTWKADTGPVLLTDIYNGEHYDARREHQGWAEPGFDDQKWRGVRIADHPKDLLVEPVGPPVRVLQTVQPVAMLTTPKGETVFDFGQNLVGRLRFTVEGPAGTTVTIHHAEVLDKEGNFYIDNLRSAKQEIKYTLKGAGPESFAPHFTFMGFRYIRVTGWPGKPAAANFTAEVMHSDMTPAGNFTCSDPLVNRLQENIQWGQRGNFVDVPTDCPQRDERMGWTGDAQAFSRTAAFNYDIGGFFYKWLADLEADQYDNGAVPHVIPHVLADKDKAATGWADAATIVPWNMYLAYGDQRFLEQQYASMKAWLGYMEKESAGDDLWNTGSHFGDWLFFSVNDDRDGRSAITDKYLIAQSFFINSADIMAQTAAVLGKKEDEQYYHDLATRLRNAYRREYLTPNGRLVSNTQTAYVLALTFDLLQEDQRAQAAQRLVDNIRSFGHLTTGFLGTPYLLHVLTEYGHADLAYELLERKEYPSWLYPVTMGATTIWERWDGIKPDSTFQSESMNSFNHYAYGAVGDWLYRRVAGIDIDPAQPGYQHLIIHPLPGGSLMEATAYHEGPYGRIESGWKKDGDRLTVEVTIPPNSTATVRLPDTGSKPVQLNGAPLSKGAGIRDFRRDGEDMVVEVGSGKYRFGY